MPGVDAVADDDREQERGHHVEVTDRRPRQRERRGDADERAPTASRARSDPSGSRTAAPSAHSSDRDDRRQRHALEHRVVLVHRHRDVAGRARTSRRAPTSARTSVIARSITPISCVRALAHPTRGNVVCTRRSAASARPCGHPQRRLLRLLLELVELLLELGEPVARLGSGSSSSEMNSGFASSFARSMRCLQRVARGDEIRRAPANRNRCCQT